MTSKNFERSIEFVKKWEGGLADDRYDSGGITKFGISAKNHGMTSREIKDLTWDQAKEIYFREYWQASGCDKLAWPLCLSVFDYAVHSGVDRAVKTLQRSIGADADGVVGPQTLLKIKDPKVTALDIVIRREQILRRLARVRAKDKKFLRGWMNRISDLVDVVTSTEPEKEKPAVKVKTKAKSEEKKEESDGGATII